MYTGFAAGTIIFFIIGQMIVTKTTRIFNKEGLKSFLIYSLIALLFLIGLNVDITGYERRVPDDTSIETAVLINNFNNSISYYQPMEEEHDRFLNPENLKAITEFHRSILENRDRFVSNEDYGYYSSIELSYDLGGLFDLSRTYMVDYEFYRDSEAMATIFESSEYKAIYSLYNLGAGQFTSITLYHDGFQETVPEIKGQKDVEELIACMEEDFRAMTFAQYTSLKHTYANAELYYTYPLDEVIDGSGQIGSVSLQIPLTSTRTIEWLEDHGYDFAVRADQIQSIAIYPALQSNYPIPIEKSMVNDTTKYGYNGLEPLMTITDQEKILKVLDRWDTQLIGPKEGYSIEIRYQPATTEAMAPGDYMMYGYLNEGLDFLK
jgi:ABC-2 type transport system permease protein